MANYKNDVEFVNTTITGRVDFATVHEPRAKYGKEKSKFDNDKEFSVKLRLDDADTLKQFKALSAKYKVSETVLNPQTGRQVSRIKEDARTGTPFVQFKRSAVNAKGDLINLPVVDSQAKTMSKETLIGNGSLVTIHLLLSIDKKTREAKSMLLNGMQVIELRTPGGLKFEVHNTGFVSEAVTEDTEVPEAPTFTTSHF